MRAAQADLFQPARIGSLTVRNRFVRAGTAETMATGEGAVTSQLVSLYERLARHKTGLIITGHMFVHASGKATNHQTGIHSDKMLDGLQRVPKAVHACGGRVFAQLGHAGSQSKILPISALLAPSVVTNPLTGRQPDRPATGDEIQRIVRAFGDAARRAYEAGFDGVHIHGANGYLISSFASPVTNQRSDVWGGDPERRRNLALAVVRAVRSTVPSDFPVTMKLGFIDSPGGITVDESVENAIVLTTAGVDGVEVSSNVMSAGEDSARRLVGVSQRRALTDLIFERVDRPVPEAYFRPYARALKKASPDTKVILVGGVRSVPMMSDLVSSGDVDFISMARPFIREPDLVEKLERGKSVSPACTSCNLCYVRSANHPVRCWRKPRWNLLWNRVVEMRERRSSR